MSVCRFSRPTSCRPCLTSSIALSYRILSGSAVFSALVDLLTFFFLRKTCASDRVALNRSSPIITNRVHRIVVGRNVDHLAVASNEVRRNLHLSLESGVPRHPSIRARDVPAGSPRLRTLKYSLNERPSRTTTLPFRPVLRRAKPGRAITQVAVLVALTLVLTVFAVRRLAQKG